MRLASALVVLLGLAACHGFLPSSRPSSMAATNLALSSRSRLEGILLGFAPVHGFMPPSRPSFVAATSLALSSQSRLEGNQREPTEEELSVMDEMISKLASAKPYELPNAVRRAFRVCSSPRFFIRIAELADKTTDENEKEQLSALASNLIATLDAVVSTTEDRLDERAREVENVVAAAAEPFSGEFLVPLSPERVEAMRSKIEKLDPSSLDEVFLSTVDAWMNKSHQDGMDGMVGILQKVLQIYAGLQVSRARALQELEESEASVIMDRLFKTDTDAWDAEIQKGVKHVPASSIIGEVHRTMETVVLGLGNGSMAQRVLAEYLRELASRVEALDTK